jgi:DNA-binding XRE family transcriptional regulator
MSKQEATTETFAVRLRRHRARAGLTQAQLADRAAIHTYSLVKLETGQRRDPALSTARALARALGVSLDALADGCELTSGTL